MPMHEDVFLEQMQLHETSATLDVYCFTFVSTTITS